MSPSRSSKKHSSRSNEENEQISQEVRRKPLPGE